MKDDWKKIRTESNYVAGEVRWTAWYVFTRILLPIIGVGVLLSATCWGIRMAGKPAEAVEGVVDRTLNPDNILYNYEFFKQAYQDIKAVDAQIANAQSAVDDYEKSVGPRKEQDWQDKQEGARLRAIVVGLKNERASMVATYNARAKMINRNIFKGDAPSEVQ